MYDYVTRYSTSSLVFAESLHLVSRILTSSSPKAPRLQEGQRHSLHWQLH